MGEDETDDWDDVPEPQSRHDRIQRITSPEGTLQRPRHDHPGPLGYHPGPGSTSSLARAHQQQQMHLAAALLQQQQQMAMLLDQHQPMPGNLASLRRQHQLMSLQAAHNNSLPRLPMSAQQLYNMPVSPAMSHRMLPQQSQRYRGGPSSLPPTNGQTLRPVHEAVSPNMSSASGRRFSQRQHEVQLEPRQLDSLSRRAAHASSGPYWGQVDSVAGLKGPFDPFVGSSVSSHQQAMYSGDGSTSSYARINPHNRQTYPPSQQSALSQNADHGYALHHDENTSLTSQKTSRTQASMLTKSAPTPSGSGSGASASGSTPQKSDATTGSATVSASAKYAEYISNLQKYQHPPPSKRHVTFIKYRGRQCTIGMLIVFAILVIGLVVAPVVYFTAFANRGQSAASAPQTQLTNMISGQLTLDTTHGAYADLMTDPGRPPDEALKRVQRDMQELLKEVVQGVGGFAADDINSITVPMPQRPEAHQIFLRFQVSLKNAQPLDVAESKTSKAFAGATNTDLVGMRLKGIPVVTNSLFFRALPLANLTSSTVSSPTNEVMVDAQPDNASRMKSELMQLDPSGSVPSGQSSNSSSVSVVAATDKQTTVALSTTTLLTTPKPTTIQKLAVITTTTSQQVAPSDLPDETFGVGVGVGSKGKKQQLLLTTFPPSSPTLGSTTQDYGVFSTSAFTFASTTTTPHQEQPTTTHHVVVTKNSESLGPAINQVHNHASPVVPFNFEPSHPSPSQGFQSPPEVGHVSLTSNSFTHQPDFIQVQPSNFASPTINGMENVHRDPQRVPNSSNLPMTTEWHSFDTALSPFNTRQPPVAAQQPHSQGPQFVTLANPNQQGTTFNLNMQNQPTEFHNQFSGPPPSQPNQDPFHPLQPNFNGQNAPFNRGHETAFGNGFSLNGPLLPLSNTNQAPPNTFAPQGSVQLNHFSADDASASTTVIDTVKPTLVVPFGHTESSFENTTVMAAASATTTTASVFNMDDFDADFVTSTTEPTTTWKTTSTDKSTRKSTSRRLTTRTTTTTTEGWPSTEYEFSDFTENVTAPVLISSWGNWSEWGACSAPVCTTDGFQSRTRVCLTSISGSSAVPDADAVCALNGGQPIEARACVCETTTTDLSVDDLTTTGPSPDEMLLDTITSTPAVVSFATTTVTAPEEKLTWSDWSNWSVCSVQPCHSNGIQTRHRSCLSNGQPAADQACFNLEGTSVDTQPCDCPVVRVATTEEPVTAVTTPTFVRTGGQFHIDSPRQPQRPLSVQVQNRPIQRRPSTTIPRTCSALEKPCNNGQCILSYRICDGFPDCSDGSDEPLGCGRCFSGEFKCTNGRCISETLVCDATDNCGDGSDEFFC